MALKASPQLHSLEAVQEDYSLGFYNRMVWAQTPVLPVTGTVLVKASPGP